MALKDLSTGRNLPKFIKKPTLKQAFCHYHSPNSYVPSTSRLPDAASQCPT